MVPIKWEFRRLGDGHDPSFGLPLCLQGSCCGETLWAYNGKHLMALRDYVSAGVRERSAPHWSMFSRLPKWISAAKNRDAVLVCIDRLDKKLSGISRSSGYSG